MNPVKRAADEELTSDVAKSVKLSEETKPAEPPKPVTVNVAPVPKPETILDYLATLSIDDLNALYIDPFTVMTVFRSLPPISKQLVLRMVSLTNVSIPQSQIRSWVNSSTENKQVTKDFRDSFQRLLKLRVLQRNQPNTPLVPPFHDPTVIIPNKKDDSTFCLNSNFQKCLLSSLANLSLETDSQGLQNDTSGSADVGDLKLYSEKKWRHMLMWMAGLCDEDQPPRNVMSRLVEMKLVATSRGGLQDRLGKLSNLGARTSLKNTKKVFMTALGVQFLLKPRRNQAWEIALSYLESLSKASNVAAVNNATTNEDGTAVVSTATHAEALKFVFRLAFLPVGPSIAASELATGQESVMRELAELGFVRVSDDGKVFHHTHLQQYLSTPPSHYPSSLTRQPGEPTPSAVAAASLHDVEEAMERFIVVETTLKVYGMTSDPLHQAMLSLFADLSVRLPDMAVGFLTRKSARRALLNGLSAESIVSWIERHAHTRMVKASQGTKDATGRRVGGTDWLIPANVTNQIRLWDEERNRLTGKNAVLIDAFDTETEYLQWQRFTIEKNVLLFADNVRQVIVVTEEGLQLIKEEKERAQKDAQRAVMI